jgi:acyl-CoA synthetase (AMP-forming)/AMP-acid ligase II
VVVPKKGRSINEADLLAGCKGRLAVFKLPKAVVLLAEIPRNPSGKILKRVLRDEFAHSVPASE